MIVFVVEDIPPAFRGELKNSLLEVKPFVFVGNVSKRIREILWNAVKQHSKSAILAYSDNCTALGFVVETHGETSVAKIGNVYVAKRKFFDNLRSFY